MRIDNIQNLQTSSKGRCLRVTLLFFVIQLFAVSHLMAEDKIVIPTLKINPGTTQQLVIQLENAVAYTAFQAEFYFPEGITPVKDSDGIYSVSLSSRSSEDHTISANVVSDGGLKVASISMTNKSLKGKSGDLFYIDIASESTFEGPATIEVKGILFTRTSDRQEIAFADVSGVVESRETLKGDANGDEKVNAQDIVDIINNMMGKPTSTGKFYENTADMNGDGMVNIADIVAIVNQMMSK